MYVYKNYFKMTRAEEKAMEAYPDDKYHFAEERRHTTYGSKLYERGIYAQGYAQGEKDAAERLIKLIKENFDLA